MCSIDTSYGFYTSNLIYNQMEIYIFIKRIVIFLRKKNMQKPKLREKEKNVKWNVIFVRYFAAIFVDKVDMVGKASFEL